MAKEFVTLTLREKDYTFRALDLDQFEALEPQFAAVTAAAVAAGPMDKGALQAAAEIATESLKFKNSEITVDEVRKLITIATVSDVLAAVRGVSMIEPAGAGAKSGEAPAGSA